MIKPKPLHSLALRDVMHNQYSKHDMNWQCAWCIALQARFSCISGWRSNCSMSASTSEQRLRSIQQCVWPTRPHPKASAKAAGRSSRAGVRHSDFVDVHMRGPTCCCTSHTATLNQHAQPSMQANSDASRRGSHKLASSSHQAMATGAPADSSAPVKNVVNTMPRQPAMPQQQATAVQQGQENSKAAQNLSPTRYTDTPHLPTNMKPALHQHTWKHF